MNIWKRNTLLMVLMLSVFWLALPAFAQDGTLEPASVQTAAATAEPGTGGEPDEPVSPLAQIPWAIIGIFVTGAAGMWKLPQIIEAIKSDKKAIAEAEARANALPAAFRDGLHKFSEVVEAAAGVIKEASDGVAAANKPPEKVDIKQVPQDVLDAEIRRRGGTINWLINGG